LESINAEFIKEGIAPKERLYKLRNIAISQLRAINKSSEPAHIFIESPNLEKTNHENKRFPHSNIQKPESDHD